MGLQLIKEYADPHIGEIVIGASFTVEMLLGIEHRLDDDYYYIMLIPNRGLVLSSCVGSITSLKGKIYEDEYDRLESCFNLNIKYWISSDLNKHIPNVELLINRYVECFEPLKKAMLWKNLAEGIIMSDMSTENKRIELIKVMLYIKEFGIKDVLEKLN